MLQKKLYNKHNYLGKTATSIYIFIKLIHMHKHLENFLAYSKKKKKNKVTHK